MKTTIIYKLLTVLSIVSLLSACNERKQIFTISGNITDAEGKILYLEHVGISKNTVLDSIELKSGNYKFQQERQAYPEFYRLRLENQLINLTVDSIKDVHVNSRSNDFATGYTLNENDPENNKIKNLTLLQIETRNEYNTVTKMFEEGDLSAEEFQEQAYSIINHYKNTAKEYISSDFRAPSAYFALFQQVNNLFIFNPYSKEDSKLYGALANTWNLYYPESPRAMQLKNLYANAQANLKEVKPLIINEADGKTLFDISLPSIDDKEIRLSESCDGKVTLIDFTAYSSENSPTHNLLLAEIYKQFQPKGMEIYQISVDADSHVWKNAATNIPWICVWDPESIYSNVALTYNVTAIPTTFIMNKSGEIVYRADSYDKLKNEIAKYLK